MATIEKLLNLCGNDLTLLGAIQELEQYRKKKFTASEYQALASRTLNCNLPFRDKMSMLSMGLAGESGEVVDLLKKALYHGHDLLPSKLKSELGDVLWYLTGMATENNMTLEEIMQDNVEKLKDRYPDGFSYERSINRK